MKDKIILVVYVNLEDVEYSERHEIINKIKRNLEYLSEDAIIMIFPTKGENKVECINPKLVSKKEYKEVLEILTRNQKIVEEIISDFKNQKDHDEEKEPNA